MNSLIKIVFLISVSITTQFLTASPNLINNPVFNQATIIGTVFVDANKNGYLDNGEIGVPGVRIATLTGSTLETDGYGRFHISDNRIYNSRFGQTQLLKVDRHSLPQGARFTSENPRALRSSNMALNKINFGVIF